MLACTRLKAAASWACSPRTASSSGGDGDHDNRGWRDATVAVGAGDLLRRLVAGLSGEREVDRQAFGDVRGPHRSGEEHHQPPDGHHAAVGQHKARETHDRTLLVRHERNGFTAGGRPAVWRWPAAAPPLGCGEVARCRPVRWELTPSRRRLRGRECPLLDLVELRLRDRAAVEHLLGFGDLLGRVRLGGDRLDVLVELCLVRRRCCLTARSAILFMLGDQVDEDAEVGQDDDEDDPQDLGEPRSVVAHERCRLPSP